MSLISDEVFDGVELNKVSGDEGGGTRAHDDSPIGSYVDSSIGSFKSHTSGPK